jgi:hypothetical protein
MKQGKHMSDTIDLLETIGKNAHLRHASADALADTLEQEDASDALKAAVIAGDSGLLAAEFGHKPLRVDQHVNGPGHEEEDPDHDDDHDHPSEPDQGEPSHGH